MRPVCFGNRKWLNTQKRENLLTWEIQRAAFVRHQFQQQGLPVEDAPPDEEARETFNFAPGNHGLVYRADVPDHGLREEDSPDGESQDRGSLAHTSIIKQPEMKTTQKHGQDIRYHLKVMKWGLIPFWTKRSPDFGSMMRTINCRDDSLLENKGMWTSMKRYKRCIVMCQGFYEWLKKGPGGKEKVPHFIKRKDGQLMCFAGLWDCVKFEDAEDKLYTYTIITTDSNKQLKFLHDRMPVVLDSGSKAMKTWLDPTKTTWTKELQTLLKPYEGALECYPVMKDVGKVGNNSADFIVPVDSKENKKNIANFFANSNRRGKGISQKVSEEKKDNFEKAEVKIVHDPQEEREIIDKKEGEDNAPVPISERDTKLDSDHKRQHSPDPINSSKAVKVEHSSQKTTSPPPPKGGTRKIRSATSNSNNTKPASPQKTDNGSQRITSFFGKT